MNSDILAEIEECEHKCTGKLSVAFRDLKTGKTIRYRSDSPCKTASVIKLPMLCHIAQCVEEGANRWDEALILTDEEKVAGSGILKDMSAGLTLTLRDVCVLMTILSDNTATNILIEKFGVKPFNERMRTLGLPFTTLFRKSYSPDTEESREFGLGKTTADEMLTLMTLLAEGKIGSPGCSAEIVGILAEQNYQDGIPRFLPSGWRYAGKTGAVDAVRNDVGLVTSPSGDRVVLSIFCQEIPTVLWTPENPGLIAIAEVSRRLLSSG